MFNKFFSVFSNDIGIDLGTANILVWVKNKGIVIREPSVVAVHRKTKKVVAIGTEAKKMLGKTPASIKTIRPLRHGVISDFDATHAMISTYIQQVHEVGSMLPSFLARPKIVIGIPSAVTEVERRAVWEAALSSGAREAHLIEEPMAAAIGAGISVFAPIGMMIVDIGGGTTEIAIISLGGIVVGRSLRIAGDEMDQAIIHYIRLRHGLLIGEATAEDLKIKIGSAYQKNLKPKTSNSKLKKETKNIEDKNNTNGEEEKVEIQEEKGEKMAVIRGRDIETGLPKGLRISEAEVREALAPALSQIIEEIAEILEEAPPELTSDILEHGILLTGGGANLSGLDHLIMERTKIPVIVSEDPLTTVIKGIGKILDDNSLLERVRVTGGLK
ncbi:MAG: rod shape-determining protein [Candidatus Berkelbacteria bacterium]|nr:rod shape-determining protein [Candidatus Berkelbacteria bacterium]